MKKNNSIRSLFLVCIFAFSFSVHAEQNYPNHSVRIIVFVPAAGAADVLARIVAQKLGDATGQTFMVDNRAGMGGVIATNLVAKAVPDGYTLLQAGITTHGIGPSLYANLPYDPVKDFSPIILSATMPAFLLVNAQLPVKTVTELIAMAKTKPESVNFGSPGSGSGPHLVGELFKIVTGIPSQHIPYKGSAPGAADLAGGHVQFMFDAIAGHQPHIQSGRTRVLAVTSQERFVAYPEVPTMKELGLAKVDGVVWYGLIAPAGTPRAIIDKLNLETRQVLAQQDVKDRLTAAGIQTAGGSPEDFSKFIKSELDRWRPVVKSAGIKPD